MIQWKTSYCLVIEEPEAVALPQAVVEHETAQRDDSVRHASG